MNRRHLPDVCDQDLAPVKFREDLLYFQHFMLILSLPQINDYHHLRSKILPKGDHVMYSEVCSLEFALIIFCVFSSFFLEIWQQDSGESIA